jgi:hypothetical protein
MRMAPPGAILVYIAFRSGLLRLDRGVGQALAALDQFFQPLGEACRRSAIDHIVIKADHQAQVFADGDSSVGIHCNCMLK